MSNIQSYQKTTWVNDETPLNATNLNKIEDGIETNRDNSINAQNSIDEILYALNNCISITYTSQNDTLSITFGDSEETPNINKTITVTLDTITALETLKTSLSNGDFVVNKSTNAENVKSNGVFQTIDTILTNYKTSTITENSTKVIESGSVYNALATKQDTLVGSGTGQNIKTINNTSIIGSGNIDIKDLFICTYNSTTTSQVTAAISNGKLPILTYSGEVYIFTNDTSSVYTFTNVKGNIVNEITLISDAWSSVTTYSLQKTALVTNFTDADNVHYPSAKLVNDTLATKQDALSSAQLSAVNSGIDSTKVGQITTNANAISDIESLIPSEATSSNQLADKSFVNSSIATHTANFKGTFTVQQLELTDSATTSEIATALNSTISSPTNNDYCFVNKLDSQSNTEFLRFKYISEDTSWSYEYTLNNSSFTSTQWAAINSGANTTNISQIATNTTAIAGKQNTIDSTHKLSSDLIDDTSSTNKFVTSTDKTTWNNKSVVSVSDTGTSTDEVEYITINGTEKKLSGGTKVAFVDWS